MKKYLPALLEFLFVTALMVIFSRLAAFAQYLPISPGVYESADIPHPPSGSGQDTVKQLVLGGLSYVKVLAGVIGIVYISLLGLKLLMASGDEEDISKARRGIVYALIAFVLISMSQDIARIFGMESGTLLGSPQEILNRVHLFDKEVEIVMTFIKYVIGTYAVVMLIRSGIKLVTSGGNEEETSKSKKNIFYSIGGLLLLYVGEIFIKNVFYKVDKDVYSGITGVHPGVDAKAGAEQIAGITNLVVSFLGPIAVLVLLGGAIMYATAGGEEEKMNKAKRLIFATILGIVIIYGAFALVSTVLSDKLAQIGAIAS
ncbi:MAG: pilin [Candidatus Peregrinibacteria bacterium]